MKEVGDGGVFAECPNLKTVSFEEGTTEIAVHLFEGCPWIESIDIPVSVGGVELFQDQYEILENTYRNNRNKGTATVQIKGIGDYGGIATVKFKIGAKGFRWFYR